LEDWTDKNYQNNVNRFFKNNTPLFNDIAISLYESHDGKSLVYFYGELYFLKSYFPYHIIEYDLEQAKKQVDSLLIKMSKLRAFI